MSKIFISYRSSDVPFGADFIYEALMHHFESDRVFRDTRSLRPGDEFDPEIMRAVRESAAMLVLIGPRWSGRRDQHRQRQIDDPNDFIHREIVEAFSHGVWVIPVLMGARRLTAADLPPELGRLALLQDVTIRPGDSESDVAALIAMLTDALPGLAEPRLSPAAGAGPVIRANKVGAVFNEQVHVAGNFTIG